MAAPKVVHPAPSVMARAVGRQLPLEPPRMPQLLLRPPQSAQGLEVEHEVQVAMKRFPPREVRLYPGECQ